MDRGRQIDNIQNTNARFLDQFGKCGKTSTRVIHPPGGEDHFSLGWGYEEPPPKYQYGRKRFDQPSPQTQPQSNGYAYGSKAQNQYQRGRSNIVFGNDDSNYDHYRK